MLAAGLAVTGTLHLVKPQPFDALIPRLLGRPRPWVYGSGVVELACAAALAVPASRRLGALASAVMFVGVFPGNVTMAARALRSPRASGWVKTLTVVRLPLQAPLVWWALDVARRAGIRPDGPDATVGPRG